MQIPKWLIAAAGLLVVVLIAVVAFLMGRETSRPPAAPTAAVAAPPERNEPPVASAVPEAAREEPKLPLAETGATAPTPSASVPRPSPEHPPATPVTPVTDDARARVAAYFKQMEAIQSAGSGDPQAFATTIANAAAGGDFSGMDDLIRSATDAERRAAALQPPSECAEYHRQAVTLLQESRTMIGALREGLKRNDTNALNAMSASAKSLQTRSESLAQAEKALRARFGL
jgi:hypothetical protein